MRHLAIDFETSGLSPERHAPVQIGVAVMEDGDVLASEEWTVGPTLHWKTGKVEREYDVRALEVSGASWPKIKASPPPKVVVAHMADFAKKHGASDLPVVAFNAPFDLAFYSTLLWLASDWHPTVRGLKVQPIPPFCGPWHCALMIARRELSLSQYSLNDVAGVFQLSRSGETHSALEDAVLAGRVYCALTGALDRRVPSLAAGAPVGGDEETQNE